MQVENRAGLEALDDILEVDGVDGVFVGPSDLAADMGFIGKADAPEVKTAVLDAMEKIVKSGKAAGILTLQAEMQKACLDFGATFVATGIDVTLFAQAIRAAAQNAKSLIKD